MLMFFSQMCQSLEVDPMTAAKVIVAVMSNESGLTLTFERPTEANVALALQDQEKASEGALVVTSREVEDFIPEVHSAMDERSTICVHDLSSIICGFTDINCDVCILEIS